MLSSLLRISHRETTFSRRGFQCARPHVRQRLEAVGRSFVDGYNLALRTGCSVELSAELATCNAERRGFGFEGAAMALALRDLLTPTKSDALGRLLAGAGGPYVYLVHVGAGWAMARVPLGWNKVLRQLHPLYRWLAYDGLGFHQGYFAGRTEAIAPPWRLGGYALRAFDQGLGRSLWFRCGADVDEIAHAIGQLDEGRRADLWSGVGLACAYAGGAGWDDLTRLLLRSADHAPSVSLGAAFAAKAHWRAGLAPEHTARAVRALCGLSVVAAALMTDRALQAVDDCQAGPAYEQWRRRVRYALQPALVSDHDAVGAVR